LKRLQVVDLVRAFSILVVLAHHLGCYYISERSHCSFLADLWYRIWINGAFGVTMFFVVSGFVITRLIASQPGGLFNPDYREFYTRRIGRIFPLLALICLIGIVTIHCFPAPSAAFQILLKDPNTPLTPAFWASIATFSFNWYQIFSTHIHENQKIGLHWGVLWSLAIEEQFYFFYPFLLKRLRNEKNLIVFLCALIVFGPLSTKFFIYLFPANPAPDKNSFADFGLIAIGCLLYLFSNRYESFLLKNKAKCVQLCWAGLFMIGIIYWHNYASVDDWWFFWAPSFLGYFYSITLAFGVFFFLLGSLHLDFFKSKYWSVIGWIGKLSYGGYLYHVMVLYLLWPFLTGKNEFLDYFLLAAATFGLAELSYRFFEVPVNLWIRKSLNHE
jgi:peptidoglycan/LPS O-acetylase OafA/YrhL